MQGHSAYPTKPGTGSRQQWMLLFIVVFFLVLGIGVGYLAGRAAVKEATLQIVVENDGVQADTVRVYVNAEPVAALSIPPAQTASVTWRVGWTNTEFGVYEVRAEPTTGFADTDRVTVQAGQVAVVTLRVG